MKRLIFCFSLLVWLVIVPNAKAQLIVIANPNVKVSEVSRADLRDIFTGASSTLGGGASVTPVLQKEGATHQEFLVQVVSKSDAALRAGWRSIVFSGQGVMPRTLSPDAAVVEYVARTPGSIGYISRAVPHDGVKQLIVR